MSTHTLRLAPMAPSSSSARVACPSDSINRARNCGSTMIFNRRAKQCFVLRVFPTVRLGVTSPRRALEVSRISPTRYLLPSNVMVSSLFFVIPFAIIVWSTSTTPSGMASSLSSPGLFPTFFRKGSEGDGNRLHQRCVVREWGVANQDNCHAAVYHPGIQQRTRYQIRANVYTRIGAGAAVPTSYPMPTAFRLCGDREGHFCYESRFCYERFKLMISDGAKNIGDHFRRPITWFYHYLYYLQVSPIEKCL